MPKGEIIPSGGGDNTIDWSYGTVNHWPSQEDVRSTYEEPKPIQNEALLIQAKERRGLLARYAAKFFRNGMGDSETMDLRNQIIHGDSTSSE